MLKTYTVRLDSELVKCIDAFIIHNNQDRLNKLSSADFDISTLPRKFNSRSEFIEFVVQEYVLGRIK